MRQIIKVDSSFFSKKEYILIKKILALGKLSRGSFTKKVEEKFAKKFKVRYAVFLSSATAGLYSVLLSQNLGGKNEVITTPFTFISTVNAILLNNIKPVFVDISEEDFNLNADLLEKEISSKTKVILGVDLYGYPCDYLKIKKQILGKKDIFLISDSAQAVGSKINNKFISEIVDAQVLSFFDTKNISCGEGGMVLTNNKYIYDRVNLAINHGQIRGKQYNYVGIGHNFRATEIQAAILLSQVDNLTKLNNLRKRNAEYLLKNLEEVPGIILPKFEKNREHVFNRFTIRVTKDFSVSRDELRKLLFMKGIETTVVYPKPLHLYKCFKFLGYKKGDFPVAERLANEVLSLPINGFIKLKQLKYIVSTIKDIYAKK